MEKKLQRNGQEKMLAGVCAGLADYFNVDVTLVRIAFVVATLAGLSGVLAYLILWIAVPVKPFNYSSTYNADYRVYEDRTHGGNPPLDPNQPGYTPGVKSRKSNNGRVIAGLILIVFGAFFLLDELNFIPYWFDFGKLWPLVFIIPGILLIAKAGKKESSKPDLHENQETEVKPEEDQTSTTSIPSNTDQTI